MSDEQPFIGVLQLRGVLNDPITPPCIPGGTSPSLEPLTLGEFRFRVREEAQR